MKYKLTKAHSEILKTYKDKWIENAMSTKAMDDQEKAICIEAVKGLYKSANLTPPPDHRIVFVSSPFIMRFAAGFASAIWHLRETKSENSWAATWDATWAATEAATWAAADAATSAATWAATSAATENATDAATWAATKTATEAAADAATSAATWDATWAVTEATDAAADAATRDATMYATLDATVAATWAATDAATTAATDAAARYATWAATEATDAAADAATRATTLEATMVPKSDTWFKFPVHQMINLAEKLRIGKFGLNCAAKASSMWQGGNQWSAFVSYLSFFKEVAKLKIDYSKYDHWETLCKHSGPRIVHDKFCIISDRPKQLLVNKENQPHNENGPFCEWRDGSALFSLNGVRVPEWVVTKKPEQFTRADVLSQENAEIRREIIRKLGMSRLAELLDYKTLDARENYELITFDIGDGRVRPYLKMKNPSIDAIHIEGVHPDCKTVSQALAWRNQMEVYIEPKKLT